MLFDLQIFSGGVYPRAQPHALSLFLFPIVFGINLIHFFDEKKDGAAGNSIVFFGASIPCQAIVVTSDEECELFRKVQRVSVQRKCELSAIQEGILRKRCKFLARKSAKFFANTKVHILARKRAKLIANFSATKVTSLPSHSLSLSLSLSLSVSLSLSHRAHLTHNIGRASALPIIQGGLHRDIQRKEVEEQAT